MSALDRLVRLLEAIDDRVSKPLDRHLALAIPPQRFSSPDRLPSRDDVERIGIWPCCSCCLAYMPSCDVVHRDACDIHQDTA